MHLDWIAYTSKGDNLKRLRLPSTNLHWPKLPKKDEAESDAEYTTYNILKYALEIFACLLIVAKALALAALELAFNCFY